MSKRGAKTKVAGKPRRGKQASGAADRDVRLSNHPRAQRQIRRAKGWGALAGFALAAYASWHSGAPFFDAVLKGLLWGTVAWVLLWIAAQQVWRHIAVAEVRAVEQRVRAERAKRAEMMAQAAEAAEAAGAEVAAAPARQRR